MATVKTVAVTSKPEHVPALRSTWRGTAEHYIAQGKRFLLVFLGAIVPQLLTNGLDNLGIDTVRALAPAALLVAIRQVWPELGAKAVDTAPGATIVPAEVDPAPDDKGAGEVRLILLFATATLLALIVWYFLAPHLH